MSNARVRERRPRVVDRRIGARFAVVGTKGAGEAASGGAGGRAGFPARALARGRSGGGRYPGYRPLVVGGLLLLLGAAVALVLVRKGGRGGDPGPEDAAPPVPPSVPGPAAPDTQEHPVAPSVEGRVRARVGGDPRTRDLPPLSIAVEDGMAWIDGGVPSREAKEALTEVVGAVEGVNIVVNRVAVGGA